MPVFVATALGLEGISAAVVEVVVTVAINFAVQKVVQALSSRPPNVIAHSQHLTERLELALRTHESHCMGVKCEVWEGIETLCEANMLITQSAGDCLEPEVPDRRSFLVIDRSLPPRSGDLVEFCDAWNPDGTERRIYGKYIERIHEGPIPPARGSKYWHVNASEWLLHCNSSGPFKLPSGARILGRRVAQITMPPGFPMDDRAQVSETLQRVAEHLASFTERLKEMHAEALAYA